MTTTSRERREEIAKAIHHAWAEAWDDAESADEDWQDPTMQHQAFAAADAAISAMLPDRAVFTALLEQCIEWTLEIGGDINDRTAVMMRDEAVRQLFALVFGDDAQAGEVTG